MVQEKKQVAANTAKRVLHCGMPPRTMQSAARSPTAGAFHSWVSSCMDMQCSLERRDASFSALDCRYKFRENVRQAKTTLLLSQSGNGHTGSAAHKSQDKSGLTLFVPQHSWDECKLLHAETALKCESFRAVAYILCCGWTSKWKQEVVLHYRKWDLHLARIATTSDRTAALSTPRKCSLSNSFQLGVMAAAMLTSSIGSTAFVGKALPTQRTSRPQVGNWIAAGNRMRM